MKVNSSRFDASTSYVSERSLSPGLWHGEGFGEQARGNSLPFQCREASARHAAAAFKIVSLRTDLTRAMAGSAGHAAAASKSVPKLTTRAPNRHRARTHRNTSDVAETCDVFSGAWTHQLQQRPAPIIAGSAPRQNCRKVQSDSDYAHRGHSH